MTPAVEGYDERPLLFDTFSCAGGSAQGYFLAGFRVIGVDHDPRPLRHYPFPWLCADALETLDRLTAGERLTFSDGQSYGLEDIAAIHASPPCQYYSRLRHLPWLRDKVYWRSIPPSRAALQATGKPYVIENVEDAAWDMVEPIVLCGTMFGLRLFRHRNFEVSYPCLSYPHAPHEFTIEPGHASLSKRRHGFGKSEPWGEWMTKAERGQALHPSMTRAIGEQLMRHLDVSAFDIGNRYAHEGGADDGRLPHGL